MIEIIKSILAGISIAIGSLVYMNCENKIVGSVLFSIGLITVLVLQFNLYTGKVAYVKNKKDILNCLFIFVGNLIGSLFCLFFENKSYEIVIKKLEIPLHIVFFKSVLCGILIYLAVELFKNTQNIIPVVFCVSTFILSGAEHSIADVCYVINSRIFTIQSVVFILVVALGNAIGSICFNILIEKSNN